ncbi:MAG: NAD-dependent epimerase/dehydratase family protein [Pirellulales bacterium]
MKLVIGCGYFGLRVARRWRDAGERVATVTRSGERAAELAGEGFEPVIADVAHRATLGKLPAADAVLFAVGYDRASGLTHRQVYAGGLENVLTALAASPHAEQLRRFLYVSTTGVYAESAGDWIDEDAPCDPNTPGAHAHLEAEQVLAASRFADRAVVMRMAGLYGPQRVPRRDDLIAGRPIVAASEGFINLIQIDDAADAVLAAEQRASPPVTLNVSDGHPVNRRTYLEAMARLIGAPSPRFVEMDASAAPVRGSASKRIGNRRLIESLGVSLRYPTYREGLASALAEFPQ